MPKVDAFELDGIEIRFYSNDHMPPHIHVSKRGDWHLKVYLLDTTARGLASEVVFERRRVPGAIKRQLAEQVSLNREALLREWEDKVQGQ